MDQISHTKKKTITIKLLNIQGLTKPKLVEIEQLITDKFDIVCLTETQQKEDRIDIRDNIIKIESMRELKDKRGGGLMILHKKSEDIELNKVNTKNSDILYVEEKIMKNKVKIVLVYFSVVKKPEDKERNLRLKREIECAIESSTEEPLIILGDLNGHIGFLGEQKINENGYIITEWLCTYDLTLLNCDDKCKGLYTWGRRNQKSVIDYVITNNKMYNKFIDMKIDEEKEITDISDHNLIEVKLLMEDYLPKKFNNKLWEEHTYYKTDTDSLQKFAIRLETCLINDPVNRIEHMNNAIKNVADETLKKTKRTKILSEENRIKEPPWMNQSIKNEIKKRKRFNREKRNANTDEEKNRLNELYLAQKKKVQIIIKEEMFKHEYKITKEIKENQSKKLWENIDRLRK